MITRDVAPPNSFKRAIEFYPGMTALAPSKTSGVLLRVHTQDIQNLSSDEVPFVTLGTGTLYSFPRDAMLHELNLCVSEVTREAVVSEPEVKPEPVAPRRTPGPENSSRKAKVRVDNLHNGDKVLVEMTKSSRVQLSGPAGDYWVDPTTLVTPV